MHMAASVELYDRMTILADLTDRVLRNVRTNSCTPQKVEGRIWFIREWWKLIFTSPLLLEIWARFVIELHSKWSCHLITLLPHIFAGFKWFQIPTLHTSTVSSETQLLFERRVMQGLWLIPDNRIIVGHQYWLLYLTFQVGCCSQTSCWISSNILSEYTERGLCRALLERLSISPEGIICL